MIVWNFFVHVFYVYFTLFFLVFGDVVQHGRVWSRCGGRRRRWTRVLYDRRGSGNVVILQVTTAVIGWMQAIDRPRRSKWRRMWVVFQQLRQLRFWVFFAQRFLWVRGCRRAVWNLCVFLSVCWNLGYRFWSRRSSGLFANHFFQWCSWWCIGRNWAESRAIL